MISRFTYAFFTVFDSFGRTIGDTCHTMSAIFAPERFYIGKADIIQRTESCTFSAADASAVGGKFVGFDKEAVKHRIYRGTHKSVVQIIARLIKWGTGA